MIPVTIKPVDPDKPPFPKVSFPKWIIPEIKLRVEEHLEFMKTQKNIPIAAREIYDLYSYLAPIFNKIKKVFTDSKMETIWKKLYALSKEKTIDFASQLFFRIENDYGYGLTLIDKHEAEIISGERMITAAKKLSKEMENYQYWFFGHVIQENHNTLMDTLSQFIENTEESLVQFKEQTTSEHYMFCDTYPLTRQSRDKNAVAIFYMRRIYLIFQESFGMPMYANIAEIINVIFGTEYTENHAIKYCKIVRPLLHDNSQ
jgi:hypothetical protein